MMKSAKKIAKTVLKDALIASKPVLRMGAGAIADHFLPGSGPHAQKLFDRMMRISGSGDYTSSAPVAKNSLFVGANNFGSSPKGITASSSGGTVRLTHREFVCNITVPSSPTDFNTLEFQVNPGSPETTPYLANMAQLFEQYRWEGLVFEFVSTTSAFNSNPAMGFVAMAAEYNVNQAVYATPREMLDSDFAISVRPDHSALYGVECARQTTNLLYVNNDRNVGTPPNLMDMCKLIVATQLGPNYTVGSVLGELWVSYDVTLTTPIYMAPPNGLALIGVDNRTVPSGFPAYGGLFCPWGDTSSHPLTIVGSGRLPGSSVVRSGAPLVTEPILRTQSTPVGDIEYQEVTLIPDGLSVGDSFRVTLTTCQTFSNVPMNLKNDPSNPLVYSQSLIFPRFTITNSERVEVITSVNSNSSAPETLSPYPPQPGNSLIVQVVGGSAVDVEVSTPYNGQLVTSEFLFKVTENRPAHRPIVSFGIQPTHYFDNNSSLTVMPNLNPGQTRMVVEYVSPRSLTNFLTILPQG